MLEKYKEIWLRGQDLNLRPSGYEPDELPDCSTPRLRDWNIQRIVKVCNLWYWEDIRRSSATLATKALRRALANSPNTLQWIFARTAETLFRFKYHPTIIVCGTCVNSAVLFTTRTQRWLLEVSLFGITTAIKRFCFVDALSSLDWAFGRYLPASWKTMKPPLKQPRAKR